jgi:NAD(P)-dependent dehydrogenase (short-subunit alcohol dehydrogenase family)
MAPSLASRGAVVTGGSRGIGAAIAGALSEAGAAVVVAARGQDDVERAAAALRARGARAFAFACDVTDEASVARLGAEARSRLGAVDILVNNAGASASAPLAKITLAQWQEMIAVNATGTFLCTREFAPDMAARRWGRVVNVASVAGIEGAKYIAHYCAAKHAVVGFTRAAAAELAAGGVTVNAVCPGYVDTSMTERTLDNVQARVGLSRTQALAAVLATAGQERLVTPGEVAAAVLVLCRDDAAGTNGQAIVLRAGAPAS